MARVNFSANQFMERMAMARKKDPTKSALESDSMCKYVVDAWSNRFKNGNIENYLRAAIRVNPTGQVADELRFLAEVATA